MPPCDLVAVMEKLSPRVFGGFLAVCLALGGCGSPEPALSELAGQGREFSLSHGCSACHGDDGEGGVGPAWQGLAGSTVALEGGGAVVADEGYLRRAIVAPEAEIVAGATIAMPVTELSANQIAALIAYIEELQ